MSTSFNFLIYGRSHPPPSYARFGFLRRGREELAAAGYEIIGVSKDKQALQKKFAETKGLQFPLIADPETTLLQELGCWGEKVTCGRKTIGILRTTYLVNEEGIIEKIFTPKEIKTKIHAEQKKILARMKELGMKPVLPGYCGMMGLFLILLSFA